MAMFVHLAPESRAKRIHRNGISRLHRLVDGGPGGIFAMPVTQSFYISHQWLRELKRRGQGPIIGVYFRLPDEERVWVGHYHQAHQAMAAAEAVAIIQAGEPREGYEVIIPRRIAPQDIHRIRVLPQVVGWHYYPGAYGTQPCGCSFCQRGQYGARQLREAYDRL